VLTHALVGALRCSSETFPFFAFYSYFILFISTHSVQHSAADISRRTKIVLHALISHFAFTLAVPPSEMSAHTEVVTRPLWLKELEKGPQLPLLVSRAEEDEERVLSENLHPPEKHLYAGAM
jgi:hypothetical protein